MTVLLETERMVLRHLTAADEDRLLELDSDPEVMRYLTGGVSTTREAMHNEILPVFLRYESPGFGVFAAIEKADGAFLGWFSLRLVDKDRKDEASLGYRLRRAVWGQGYATEGVRALIRRAFTETDVQRVIATTYEDNLGSRRVMEKAGLVLVRTFHMTIEELRDIESVSHDAAEVVWDGDDVEYALRKDDWERRKGIAR